jgi:hypothetical protein
MYGKVVIQMTEDFFRTEPNQNTLKDCQVFLDNEWKNVVFEQHVAVTILVPVSQKLPLKEFLWKWYGF